MSPSKSVARQTMSPFSSPAWDLQPPQESSLGDHDVPQLGQHLRGRSVLLMVCGGIAAMKAPLIARALRKYGAQVTAMVSREALRYVTEDALSWSCDRAVITDLSARAEHLGDGAHFDAYLIAPATYNTINKCAQGIADGALTATLASALGRVERGKAQLLIAPTMHGSMHNSILTSSLKRLEDLGARVIPPREAYGKHNIPSERALVWEVARSLSESPLRGKGVLVTGGPTPVRLDGVRRLTNKFTGRLAIEIAEALHLRGARVKLLLGAGSVTPPAELGPYTERAVDFDAYLARTLELSAHPDCAAGVFSAAVADYAPQVAVEGKMESGQPQLTLHLRPTPKVIDEVRRAAPSLKMVTFKYQEGVTHEELMEIVTPRLERFEAVFANRGEERGAQGAQVGWLCVSGQPPARLEGKPHIAQGIADELERRYANTANCDSEDRDA